MDGVLVSGRTPIAGAREFLARLEERKRRYLLLTNNPIYTPGDLSYRLGKIGLEIPPDRIFTAAMATASFLATQRGAGGTAFVIGESGLSEALHEIGFIITDHEPEYVVLGETHSYNLEQITRAIRFLAAGARFVATNPDKSGPTEEGIAPANGAMAALMEAASGVRPFFVGKPNPLMMRTALNHLGVHSEQTVMIGDNMETDIIGGLQAGLETVLVLSGVTSRSELSRYSYQPNRVVASVDELER
ncbi:MAG: HAD family hydrolase [Kofleriaceae bacterium]|nr:HAD family hydrolase [Myxococcales bacterium]MCB9560211.1 HAD family hydrolase [Kofleriaceae bacterium]MCB9571226.1 HAD family hydrolase [Kofleriaceae bacterium]